MAKKAAETTNAVFLAEEARIGRIAVPRAPGLFCALGALISDLRRDFVRSLPRQLAGDPDAALAAVFAELAMSATEWLSDEGVAAAARELRFSADMRYLGQAFDLGVALPEDLARSGDAERIRELFHTEHLRIHGFADDAATVEFRNLRVVAMGHTDKPPAVSPEGPVSTEEPVRRQCYLAGRWTEAIVQRRADLLSNRLISGPAVLEQDDTTIIVPSGWRAMVTESGVLDLRREG